MTATHDRLMELLTDRALVGLGQREQIELAELLVKVQDVDVAAFDVAAAAVALATIGPLEPIPSSVAESVEARALAMFDAHGGRPASDFVQTRDLVQLAPKVAPGFAQTTVDEVMDATDAPDVQISKDFKRTHVMDQPAPHVAAPTPILGQSPVRHLPAPAPAPVPAPQQPPAPHIATAPSSFMPGAVSTRPGAQSYGPGSGAFAPPSHPPPYSSQRPGAPSSQPSNVVAFPGPAARSPSRAVAFGGWVAAAACFLLAIGAFAYRSSRPAPVAENVPPAIPTSATAAPPLPAPSQTPAQLREQLLAQQSSARADWSPTKDPAGKAATGEVVWNKDQQRGTMRFRGLAKNDPKVTQYQLWIFDKTRDDKYPVDGGVFDVDSDTGDVVVPIRATLPVNTPVLFAVTVEKPGGVVVSKRERIVVTAKIGG